MDTVQDCEQLRRQARRRLPRFAFDFIDGGAGREAAMERNVRAFAAAEIVPDPLHAMRTDDIGCDLFGQHYAAPFGIAPMGGLGLLGTDADLAIARAAAACELPYVLSAAANTALEVVAEAAQRAPWMQLYCPQERAPLLALVDRARVIGCPVLMLTIDMPAVGKRLRDLRNGASVPFRWTWKTLGSAASHPRWSLGQLRNGPLRFPNLQTDEGETDIAQLMARQTGGRIDWDLIAALRDRWPGALVLKGVQCAALAARAGQLGCDGVIVSNHGGRQLDGAPAALRSVGEVAAAAGKGFVAMDSGLRNGEDLLKARLAGARLGFFGRPVAYAYAAGGEAAVTALLHDIKEEYVCARLQAGEGSPHTRILAPGANPGDSVGYGGHLPAGHERATASVVVQA
ncbi:alpha-hydroxy acid oxidase [Cognatiluteimonas telluris]|uniref:alpha-hydroxy acid oxidase n=1 Tax=Cognatiluteimonas telluris TaxID=1104775 RepID=UPI0014094282|nr:alpha-hydroxy acid oxidase [Lysobacter telluris]